MSPGGPVAVSASDKGLGRGSGGFPSQTGAGGGEGTVSTGVAAESVADGSLVSAAGSDTKAESAADIVGVARVSACACGLAGESGFGLARAAAGLRSISPMALVTSSACTARNTPPVFLAAQRSLSPSLPSARTSILNALRVFRASAESEQATLRHSKLLRPAIMRSDGAPVRIACRIAASISNLPSMAGGASAVSTGAPHVLPNDTHPGGSANSRTASAAARDSAETLGSTAINRLAGSLDCAAEGVPSNRTAAAAKKPNCRQCIGPECSKNGQENRRRGPYICASASQPV